MSYRDPDSAPGRGQKTLHVTGDMNLTKMFSKAIRELSNPLGSTVTDVDNHIRTIYTVDVPPGLDFQVELTSLFAAQPQNPKFHCANTDVGTHFDRLIVRV